MCKFSGKLYVSESIPNEKKLLLDLQHSTGKKSVWENYSGINVSYLLW